MSRIHSVLWVVAVASLWHVRPAVAYPVAPIMVINEVFFHPEDLPCPRPAPSPGAIKFVEIRNVSPNPINTANWYICEQPGSNYIRLLESPQFCCLPGTGVDVKPGDFLVLRFDSSFTPYTSHLNESGTTTHIVSVFIPAPNLACYWKPRANTSIWDQSPPNNPNAPSWDSVNAMRDFLTWSPDGTYTGAHRGCIAAHPQVQLWPPPIVNDCVNAPDPTFVAVNTASMPPQTILSINYNGGSANNPTDYFIAPSTEGERNVMPGDLDDDFDMDENDFNLFTACLNLPADPPYCRRADFDHDLIVDCEDWPAFAAFWEQYSTQPLPPSPCVPCMPGDFNNDGVIDGDDLQGSVVAFTGSNPPCAADVDTNGEVNCEDIQQFTRMLLAAPADCLRGDVNLDGLINGADIHPFATTLMIPQICLTPAEICLGDINADQVITLDDVDPFVQLLLIQVEDRGPTIGLSSDSAFAK